MAPEQVAGHRGEVTTAADVYGLGAVLYKLLTGRPPFQADSVYETLRQVREQEPVPPGTAGRRVDRDLDGDLSEMPGENPQAGVIASAEAMADDLDRWLAGEPIAARPIGQVPRGPGGGAARNRVVAGLSASVAALLVTVTAVATVSAFRQHIAGRNWRTCVCQARTRQLACRPTPPRREIRWRLVRMNVENGNRLIDQGT